MRVDGNSSLLTLADSLVPPKTATKISDLTGFPSIREIIESKSICTYFQPILSARQKTIVGLEALSRGLAGVEAVYVGGEIDGRALIAPSVLFRMADREGLSAELEELCRESAARRFAGLLDRPEGLVLFMNIELSLALDPGTPDRLFNLFQGVGVSTRNVAIEILESRFDDLPRLFGVLSRFRQLGFLVALDDVGAGHSNLDRIPMIRPDILKVDRSLVSGIDGDYYKQETLKSLVGLSRRIGALVVAEGLETEKEAMVSLELGADMLQGNFLSPPHAVTSLCGGTVADATARTEELAGKFKIYMVRKMNQQKLQHRRFNVILNELLCDLTNANVEEFDELLNRTISEYSNVECIYVLNDTGTQVTDTICNMQIPRRQGGVIFHPAPKGTDHSLKEYYYVLMDVELQKFTTDPYVSLASGNVCRTMSSVFRDAENSRMYVLCVDVKGE